MVKPLTVLEPDCAISLRFQYGEETCRGRYRPVTTNRTYPLVIPSCIRSASPTVTCSSAAAVAGRAAGTGWPRTGAPGQLPEVSSAWPVMPPSAAASAIGVLPVPAAADGAAGSEPGTNPSGSDQSAW